MLSAVPPSMPLCWNFATVASLPYEQLMNVMRSNSQHFQVPNQGSRGAAPCVESEVSCFATHATSLQNQSHTCPHHTLKGSRNFPERCRWSPPHATIPTAHRWALTQLCAKQPERQQIEQLPNANFFHWITALGSFVDCFLQRGTSPSSEQNNYPESHLENILQMLSKQFHCVSPTAGARSAVVRGPTSGGAAACSEEHACMTRWT